MCMRACMCMMYAYIYTCVCVQVCVPMHVYTNACMYGGQRLTAGVSVILHLIF